MGLIPIQSKLEGCTYALYKLEEVMKPLGYSIGGNWDYDKGCFDYKIDEEEGYQFLRSTIYSGGWGTRCAWGNSPS